MLKMYIDNEEVVSKNDFTIKEEMLSASSTILNNTYPKSWEQDKDYISRFYYPKDYSKLILNKDTYYPHIDGETIEGSSFQITADTTLEDDYYFKGNTYQEQTPTPTNPQPIQVVTGNQEIEVCGKNYFDINGVIEGATSGYTYTIDGTTLTVPSSTGNAGQLVYSKLYNGGTYNLSFTKISGTLRIVLRVYNNGTLVTNEPPTGFSNYNSTYQGYWKDCSSSPVDVIVPNNYQFKIVFVYTNWSVKDIQLEKGSTSSNYEPYIGNTYSINLGKNLLQTDNISWGSSGTYNLTLGSNLEPGTYILSGANISVSSGAFNLYGIDLNNTQDTLKANAYWNNMGTGYSFTTTKVYKQLKVYTNIAVSGNLQLEKGSVATSFSPYFTPIELCKIGDYKDKIYKDKNETTNLFNIATNTSDNYAVNTYISSISGNTMVLNGASGASSRVIRLQNQVANKTYIVSFNTNINTNRILVRIRKSDDSGWITNSDIIWSGWTYNTTYAAWYYSANASNNKATFTFTVPSGLYWQLGIVNVNSTSATFSNIQLEEGEVAHQYVPYGAEGKWILEKNIGKVQYNGTETWTQDTISGGIIYWYNKIWDSKKGTRIADVLLSTHFKPNRANDDNGFYLNNQNLIVFNHGIASTLVDYKTWLGNNLPIVYYVLATPTYTEITNEELISQLNSIELLDGLNNISITSANLPMIMNLHYNYQTEHTDSELIFSGMVKNTNNISLNPREPKYCSLEILDYKTLLSEGKTLDYVISNKTILEAITMVVNSISEYGFELGNVNILNGNEIIGAYSTENKTAYDVLQYLADISSAKWNCRRKDNTNMYIDFYDPTLMPRGKQIEYTNEWARENNLCDIKFNYGTRDYRNKQIILSDEVEGSIEYNDRVVSDGINKEYTLPYKIASLNKIEIDGVEQSIATKEEKEVGIYADFYYSRNTNTFTSNKTLPYGTLIDVSYTPIIKGREVVQNDSEIDRLTNQLEVNGTISRYENRNDTTDSNKLINIGETYLKYKGEAEITLTIRTENNNLYNVGQIVYFNAPIPELQKDYLVKSKQIQVISSDENELNIFYTFTLSSSFNAEKEINWFDNQRAKTEGNIGEGEFISRNIDINSRANIIWDNLRVEEVDLPVGANNDLQATLESPLIH